MTVQPPAERPAPGYYPDPSIPGFVRYWDGDAWTPGSARPAPQDGAPLPPPPRAARGGVRVAPPPPPRATVVSLEETGPVFLDEGAAQLIMPSATSAPRDEPAAPVWAASAQAQPDLLDTGTPRHVTWGVPVQEPTPASGSTPAPGTGTGAGRDPRQGAPDPDDELASALRLALSQTRRAQLPPPAHYESDSWSQTRTGRPEARPTPKQTAPEGYATEISRGWAPLSVGEAPPTAGGVDRQAASPAGRPGEELAGGPDRAAGAPTALSPGWASARADEVPPATAERVSTAGGAGPHVVSPAGHRAEAFVDWEAGPGGAGQSSGAAVRAAERDGASAQRMTPEGQPTEAPAAPAARAARPVTLEGYLAELASGATATEPSPAPASPVAAPASPAPASPAPASPAPGSLVAAPASPAAAPASSAAAPPAPERDAAGQAGGADTAAPEQAAQPQGLPVAQAVGRVGHGPLEASPAERAAAAKERAGTGRQEKARAAGGARQGAGRVNGQGQRTGRGASGSGQRRAKGVRPALLGPRIAARLVDTLVCYAVVGVLGVVLMQRVSLHLQAKVDAARASGVPQTVWLIDGTVLADAGLLLAALLVVGVVYETIPVAVWGRTLGKAICGLTVVDARTKARPRFVRTLLRTALCQTLVFLLIGILELVPCAADRKLRQSWHDKLGGTFVAKQ